MEHITGLQQFLTIVSQPDNIPIGMMMILVGLTGLTLAWIHHRQEMKALRAEVGPMPYSIAGIMAGFIAGLGAIALILVAFRL